MSDKSTLKGLKITMKKHPVSLKLEGSLKNLLDSKLPLETSLVIYEGIYKIQLFFIKSKFILKFIYKGSVRELSKLAPNNVNTMAVGALCAQNLGFDKVQACLIADPE
jgi:aspartate dehydrogenase